MLKIGRAQETSFMMTFFRPGIGKINVEAVHRIIRHKVGYKDGGVRANDAHIGQTPSADAVNRVTVILAGPFDAEVIVRRFGFGLVEKERSFAGADFDMDGARASENPNKINFAVQIFGF